MLGELATTRSAARRTQRRFSRTDRFWLAFLARNEADVWLHGNVTITMGVEGTKPFLPIARRLRIPVSYDTHPRMREGTLRHFLRMGWLEPYEKERHYYRLTEAGKAAAKSCRLARRKAGAR